MRNKLENTKILRYAKKLKSINYLGGCCKICKEGNLFKLTFHHINTDDKEFGYNKFSSYRWSKLKKELDKCNVLCQNCHRKIHYDNSISYDKRRENKIVYLEYSGGKCIKCGYDDCPASLSFHHRDPNVKDFWIGKINENTNSILEISLKMKSEIDKCDLLCQNCHALEHSDIEFFKENKDTIISKSKNYKEIQSKLNHEEVIEMYKKGVKQIEIAKYFSASKGTISSIIKKYLIC